MRMLQRQNTKHVIAKQISVSVWGVQHSEPIVLNDKDTSGVMGEDGSKDVKIDVLNEGGDGSNTIQKLVDSEANIDGFGNSSLSAAPVQQSEHLRVG